MDGNIETKKLPNDIANYIQAWMYDMQSEYKTGTYFLDAGYLGTISIRIKNQEVKQLGEFNIVKPPLP